MTGVVVALTSPPSRRPLSLTVTAFPFSQTDVLSSQRVRVDLLDVTETSSSSLIVPVAVEVAVTLWVVPETASPTVNVSSPSSSPSSVVATVKLTVSPAVPAKSSAVVFSV